MSQSKKIIHVGGCNKQPSDIGAVSCDLPTWCSEGTSSPDFIQGQKNRQSNHLISGTINAGVFLPRMTDVRTWDMALKAVVAGILKGNESALVVNNS